MLPLNLSDTAATTQDGSSLEYIAAIAGRQCYIQDASDRGLCTCCLGFVLITKIWPMTFQTMEQKIFQP